MKYKVFVPADVKHVYKFTPEKKLTDKITAMAGVEVYDLDGVKIGGYAFTRAPRDAFDDKVTYMVGELIREYYTRKAWNRVTA